MDEKGMTKQDLQMSKVNLKGLSLLELEDLVVRWGEPKYRAKQLMSWLYHQRAITFESMTNLPGTFRHKLQEVACISGIRVCARAVSDTDSAVKYLFELADGSRIESVLMTDRSRITVCVSSQVGCAMACDFCATGKMGFFRNLSTAEILEQLVVIQRELEGKKKP
jgi:23S rRNA (adenine2503-C2)-methyltransferase